jgi:large subunit ribosomal protein L10
VVINQGVEKGKFGGAAAPVEVAAPAVEAAPVAEEAPAVEAPAAEA